MIGNIFPRTSGNIFCFVVRRGELCSKLSPIGLQQASDNRVADKHVLKKYCGKYGITRKLITFINFVPNCNFLFELVF